MSMLPKIQTRTLALLEKWRCQLPHLGAFKDDILNRLRVKTRKAQERIKSRSHRSLQEISSTINQVTGYAECEKLRVSVKNADQRFQELKEALRHSRMVLDQAIQSRCQCQKELNALLQRKQSWLDEDLLRFTELYRKEMRLEQAELEAKLSSEKLEKDVDAAHQALMDALRERYQEEQLWSDKIRRLSTYGTFSLMSLNVLLFLVIQLMIEPRKREKFLVNLEAILADRMGQLHSKLDERFASINKTVTSLNMKQKEVVADHTEISTMHDRFPSSKMLTGAAGATLLCSLLYVLNRMFTM